MSGARVESVDALKYFRIALLKFAETANIALGDAEGEVNRISMWLGHEQQQYWQQQIRKRQELVARAKDAVRQKKLFKDSSGREQSAVDEEKQLMKAMKRLEEAEQKLLATKRHYGLIQKETHSYKGSTQRLSTAVTSDLPNAAAKLNNLIIRLEEYLNIAGPANDLPVPGFGDEGSMAQSADEAPAEGATAEATPAGENTGESAPPPEAKDEAPPAPSGQT
jgi:hypothetical protein